MPVQGDTFDMMRGKGGRFPTIAGNEVAGIEPQDAAAARPTRASRQAAAALGGTKPMWLVNNLFLFASDPDSPEIGDIRIGYERGDVTRVSAVGKQSGRKAESTTPPAMAATYS